MISNAKRLGAIAALLFISASAAQAVTLPTFSDSGCAAPAYRNAWRNADQQGFVKLAYVVGADGKVVDAKVVESSGFTSLDLASLRALRECTFKPQAEPGKVTQNLRFEWKLQ